MRTVRHRLRFAVSPKEPPVLPWLFAVLLVLLLVGSPTPLVHWTWDNVPGGSGWYLVIIAATVGFFMVRRG